MSMEDNDRAPRHVGPFVEWVKYPTEILPWPQVMDDSVYSIMGRCNTPPDGNEIILVQSNIHGTLSLIHVLLHELLHWLTWKFKVSSISRLNIDDVIDEFERRRKRVR